MDAMNAVEENVLIVPPIPPKLLFNNMKEENVQKRLVGLQAFLDGICAQSIFTQTDLVRNFLLLNKRELSPIYQIPDEIFSSIFRYVRFNLITLLDF
jgi:hypothetical protein